MCDTQHTTHQNSSSSLSIPCSPTHLVSGLACPHNFSSLDPWNNRWSSNPDIRFLQSFPFLNSPSFPPPVTATTLSCSGVTRGVLLPLEYRFQGILLPPLPDQPQCSGVDRGTAIALPCNNIVFLSLLLLVLKYTNTFHIFLFPLIVVLHFHFPFPLLGCV